ncbi:MAG: hypothetical protein NT082_04035 [Chloroflexi bacterium]|nr:hypothetical protein [Chloroflexota bacterium]
MKFNPLVSFFKTVGLLLTGRLHFPRGRVGEIYDLSDGRRFTIFRQVIVNAGKNQPEKPGAVFQVCFQIAGMTPKQNEVFSLFPIAFFIGLPGFRSKLWMADRETGDCQGIYEWDTVQDAERYADSFAMRFMMLRSVPGSVWYRVSPL